MLEAVGMIRSLSRDLHLWKEKASALEVAAREEKVLKDEAVERANLLEKARDDLATQVADHEAVMASMALKMKASEEELLKSRVEIEDLRKQLQQAPGLAVEAFKCTSIYRGIGPKAVDDFKSSDEFRAEMDASVKRFQASSEFVAMAQSHHDDELRTAMKRMVEDLHSMYPDIDFRRVRDIGAFGEFHLREMGRRKRKVPPLSGGHGAACSSKKPCP